VTTTKPKGSFDATALCRLRGHTEISLPTLRFGNGDPADRQRPIGAAGKLDRQLVEETPRPRQPRLGRWSHRPPPGHPGCDGPRPMRAPRCPCGRPCRTAHGSVGQATAWPPGQLALKLSGLVMGVVSHQAFTDRSAPTGPLIYKHVTWQGSFPRARLCCPRPSSGPTTPSATLPARRDFPFQRLYAPPAPGPQRPGPGRASPVPVSTPWPSRSPYPGGFLSACTSRSSAPSMAFAVNSAARHPPVPSQG
jgi:hypothetical protein